MNEMLNAIRALVPWVAKGIADNAFDACANPLAAKRALENAERILKNAGEERDKYLPTRYALDLPWTRRMDDADK